MGWPVSKQAAYHGLFQNGPNKKLLLIGLTGVKMGWPVLKWAARFKMGQITNRAVTYIRSYPKINNNTNLGLSSANYVIYIEKLNCLSDKLKLSYHIMFFHM